MPYVINLVGSHGGTLDTRTVATEDDIADAVIDIANTCSFVHGDSIQIIDTEAE